MTDDESQPLRRPADGGHGRRRADEAASATDPGAVTWAELTESPHVRLRRLPTLVTGALRLCWRAAPRELAVVSILQAVGGLGLVVPILAGRDLFTELLASGRTVDPGPLLVQGAVLLAVLGAINLAGTVAGARDDILGELVNQHATRRILDVACSVPLEQFDRPAFHNRLQRASMTAGTHPYQIVRGLNAVLQAILVTVGVTVALAAIQPVLVALTLVAAVPLWLAGIKGGQVLFAMFLRLTPAERERAYLAQLLTQRDSAIEVRAYGLARHLRQRWEKRTAERLDEIRGGTSARLRVTLVARLLAALVLGVALAVLGGLALAERMSIADAGTAAGATLLLATRLRAAAMGTDLLFEAAPFVIDLEAFLDLATRQPRRSPPAASDFRCLTVEGLTFTYPSATRAALRGVDLEIQAGEVVALVGENGSGKTTLAKLLCHLYQPHGGRIRYDGVDVTQADPEPLRRSIAVLFQDFQRYLLSAEENIGVGRWENVQDHAAIVSAATAAGANAFLAGLPQGYATLLGPEFDGGTDLSGGQWQRVALARAFFRDASFVILDEPTAALDARAEHELFARVRALLAGRTVLLISHRFSTVRSADRIYVMADGRITEHGTHDELMARGGRYAELFTLQAAPYVDAVSGRACG